MSLFFSSPGASLSSLSRAGQEEKRNPGNQPRPQGFSLRKWKGPWKSLGDEVAREFDGFTLFHRHNLLFCFFSSAVERLKACDDAFRKQLEQERQANEQQIQTLNSEKQQEIDRANARVRNSRLPITLNFKENRKSSSYREFEANTRNMGWGRIASIIH